MSARQSGGLTAGRGQWRGLATTLALLALGAHPVAADDAEFPRVGSRVRLTAPTLDHKRLVGRVVAVDDTSVTLEPGAEKAALPSASE